MATLVHPPAAAATPPGGYRPRRRVPYRIEQTPLSWGRCPVRLREHWHWLKVCADCGQHQPPRLDAEPSARVLARIGAAA